MREGKDRGREGGRIEGGREDRGREGGKKDRGRGGGGTTLLLQSGNLELYSS